MVNPRLSGSPVEAPERAGDESSVRRVGRDIRELVQARELTVSLVRRELKARHRGTFFGMLWSLTNPLLLVGLYYVIFKFILKTHPVDDLPRPDNNIVPFAVYFFSGLTIWNLFSNSAGAAPGSIVGSGYLLRKVYFPRAILPLSTVLSSLVTFGFELAVLLVIVLVAVGPPSAHILWVPAIVALVTVLSYGFSLFLSAATVFFRDVAHFIGVLMQLWFWATPIVYSLSFVSDKPGLVRILEANPLTGIVISFRNVVVLNRPPDFELLAYNTLFALAALLVGAYVFRRWQGLFAEIV